MADVVYNIVTLFAGAFALGVGAVGTMLTRRWRERRKGSEDVKAAVRRHDEALYGRRPSVFEKHPPAGLIDQMSEFATVQANHTTLLNRLLDKVTPNGGNTRETGDLLLLIAERLGINVPDERADDGS